MPSHQAARHADHDTPEHNYFGNAFQSPRGFQPEPIARGNLTVVTTKERLSDMSKSLLHAIAISVAGWVVIITAGYLAVRWGLSVFRGVA